MDEFLTFQSCNRKAIQFLQRTPSKFRIDLKVEKQRTASRVFHDGFDENDEPGEYETSLIFYGSNAVALLVAPRIINYFSGARMWSFAHERMPLRPLAAANLRKIIRKPSLLAEIHGGEIHAAPSPNVGQQHRVSGWNVVVFAPRRRGKIRLSNGE